MTDNNHNDNGEQHMTRPELQQEIAPVKTDISAIKEQIAVLNSRLDYQDKYMLAIFIAIVANLVF